MNSTRVFSVQSDIFLIYFFTNFIEMADYCIGKMKPYIDPNTGMDVMDAYDFMDFTRTLFQNQ